MQIVSFKAARDIECGEELTFYYGSNLWFQNKETGKSKSATLHEHMDDENLVLNSITL